MSKNMKKMISRMVSHRSFPYVMAFLMPFIICVVICIGNGVYPFGDNCILHIDMYHQYCPFFTEFLHKLRTGGSLQYSWNLGLGSDFVSLYAYYLASPLNFLIVLCPKHYVIEFMTILVLAKIALCGLTFFLFLKYHFHLIGKDSKLHKNQVIPALVFSTAYALSGFVAAYSWDIMWMDCILLFPLIMVGLEKLVREQKPGLYFVTLALSVFANYYISIMICIFLVFYFILLFFTQKGGKLKAFLRFAWYSLLAGSVSMVLLLPEIAVLSASGSAEDSFPKTLEWYFSVIAELGRAAAVTTSYTGNDHWPNLYAGAFSVMLLILFVLNKRINWKKKIAPVLFVLFFMASFANKQLDFIWHGLHFPDSLPGRQSYLYAFLILTIGYATVRKWRGIRLWHIGVAVVFASALMAVSTMFAGEDVTEYYAVIISILFVALYGIMTVLLKLAARKKRELLMVITCGIAIVELAVNMAVTGLGCTGRSSYNANVDDMQKALELAKEDAADNDVPFYRVEDTGRLTKNDGTRYGYASGTQFSSLMNINVSHFYQALYMEGGKNFYCYNGATPVTSAMLSVRYMVTKSIQPQNELTTLVGKCGNHYLYRNNYTLPLGIMMDEGVIDAWKPSSSSKIYSINSLGRLLGAADDTLTLTECIQDENPGTTTLTFDHDGYYYAAYDSCSTDSLTFSHGEYETTYSKTTHRYLFDLGYVKAGETVSVTNTDADAVRFNVYELSIAAVESAYNTLNDQTLSVDDFSDTHISGHIDVKRAGQLVLSIPSEKGWTMKVDGKDAEYEDFSDTFVSIHLDEGEHEIELYYKTPGLKAGAAISAGCVGVFLLLLLLRQIVKRRSRLKFKANSDR